MPATTVAAMALTAAALLSGCVAAHETEEEAADVACLYPTSDIAALIAEKPRSTPLDPAGIVAVDGGTGDVATGEAPVVVMMSFGTDHEQVGLWALSELERDAEVFAVDEVAKEVSLWSPSPSAVPSPSDAALERARACLR